MNEFVQKTTGSGCTQSTTPDSSSYGPNGIVMDYYDGNTVTGLWNLAQHFSLNDNSYSTQFGPSSPGAINLISGQTNGAEAHGGVSTNIANGTLFGDGEPYHDQCSNNTTAINADGTPGGVTVSLSGKNIGDLMNAKGVTWGWFQGGFRSFGNSARRNRQCLAQRRRHSQGIRRGSGIARGVHRIPRQHRRCLSAGLCRASRAVPVLRQHGQPRPRLAELGLTGRPQRSDRNAYG